MEKDMHAKPKANKALKLAKYLEGVGASLKALAREVRKGGELTRDNEELMSRIGAELLFRAKTYEFKDL